MKGKLMILSIMAFAIMFISGGVMASSISSTGSNSAGVTWSTGSAWVGGVAPGAADDAIIVAGDSIIVGAAVIVTNLTIQSGAKLVSNASISGGNGVTGTGTFTIVSGGYFYANYSSATKWPQYFLSYSIDPNSYYVATNSASSTIINAAPYYFGNLTVLKTGSVMGNGGNIDINGNLIVRLPSTSTSLKGANSGHSNGTVTIIHVHKNVFIVEGQLTGIDAANSGQVVVWQIDGDVTVGDASTPSAYATLACVSSADAGVLRAGNIDIGGTLNIINGGKLEAGTNATSTNTGELSVINLSGNFSTDGTATFGVNTVGRFAINFVGTGTQTVTLGVPFAYTSGTLFPSLADTIGAGSSVVFNGGYSWGATPTGNANGNGQWVVTGKLTLGATDQLTGIQAFSLASGATLTLANPLGLASGSSIQVTGTQTYSTGANYGFNGSAAQVTGAELPATVHNLTFDNSDVTLTTGTAVSGDFTIAANNFTLTSSAPSLTAGEFVVSHTIPDLNGSNLSPTLTDGVDVLSRRSNQFWILSQPGITGTYDLTVDGGAQTGIGNVDSLRIIHSDDGTNFDLVGTNSPGSGTAVANRTAIPGSTQGRFYLGGNPNPPDDNPLPVEMTSFTATASASEGTTLHWSMSSELNNSGWDVQRATVDANGNVSAFTKIGYVKGSTNSVESTTYSFVDRTALYGTFEYRLNQIDVNGGSKFTNPIKVAQLELPKSVELGAYPNPFNPTATLRYALPEAGSVVISVYNSIGQLVTTLLDKEMDAGIFEVSFNASSLPSGVYFARLSFAGKENNTVRISKMMLVK